MFDVWEHQHLTGHLWSLAVEEQFYLIWPILFAAVASRRGWAEGLAWALVGASLGGPAVRLLRPAPLPDLHPGVRDPSSAAPCAWPRSRVRDWAGWIGSGAGRRSVFALMALTIGIPGVLVPIHVMSNSALETYVYPAFCVASAPWSSALWHGPPDRTSSALSWGPLAYLGRISYGIYLYHMLAHYLAWSVLLAGHDSWPGSRRYGLRLSMFLLLALVPGGL